MERAANNLARETTPPSTTDGPIRSSTLSALPSQEPQSLDAQTGFPQPIAASNGVRLDNMVDFSLLDAVSGQDVFGHIDPTFNLDAVEDALEANLDIGLPLNWGDWGQFAT
jgi:hypothetical protein